MICLFCLPVYTGSLFCLLALFKVLILNSDTFWPWLEKALFAHPAVPLKTLWKHLFLYRGLSFVLEVHSSDTKSFNNC